MVSALQLLCSRFCSIPDPARRMVRVVHCQTHNRPLMASSCVDAQHSVIMEGY